MEDGSQLPGLNFQKGERQKGGGEEGNGKRGASGKTTTQVPACLTSGHSTQKSGLRTQEKHADKLPQRKHGLQGPSLQSPEPKAQGSKHKARNSGQPASLKGPWTLTSGLGPQGSWPTAQGRWDFWRRGFSGLGLREGQASPSNSRALRLQPEHYRASSVLSQSCMHG